MTIRKHSYGKYLPAWRDLVAKGRARKRAARPKRDILAIKAALSTLKLKYCQEISFWNPLHRGKHGDLDGGLQWVDFVVKPKGKRPFIIILDDPSKRWKSYEKVYHSNKLMGLDQRNVSYLVLRKGMTSQEYQVQIAWHMRKVR
jgi:hypothetical protein